MAANVKMAEAALAVRRRAIWVPREHGAWGMLLIPLATGAGVAGRGDFLSLGFFTLAALALFWLRTPLESLLGTSVIRAKDQGERRLAWMVVLVLALIALASIAILFWKLRPQSLIAIGSIAAFAFVAQAVLKKQGRSYRSLSQIVGSIGLTCTSAAAYFVMSGKLDRVAIGLWTVNWLFTIEQILFVQLRIRGARLHSLHDRLSRGRAYLLMMILIFGAIVMLAAGKLVPVLAIVAFCPALIRSGVWFTSRSKPLDVHTLGWMELANAVLFGTLLVISFYWRAPVAVAS